MTRFLIAIIALMFAGCQAQAGWPHDAFDTWHAPAPRKHVHKRHHKPKVINRTVRRSAPAASSRCLALHMAVGDQALTKAGAQDAAEKAWQQELRFDKGEMVADPQFAEEKKFWCVKSSVSGGLFHRCRMRARPCQPPGTDQ